MRKYIPKEVEQRSQAKWAKSSKPIDLERANKPSSAKATEGKKYYLLVEFTYPSGDLHMGHWFAFAVPDILARYKRMQGYNVFVPNGFDAFGLPAENAAIQRKIHPKDWTYENIDRMRKQFETMGAIYDWGHSVITCDAEYYKWNQWIFLKMFERGLAYKGKVLSNWCPVDKTVLANENVENGKCWRCGAEVVQKEVEQWFFKITDYADELIWDDKNASTEWPKPLKEGQNNWIGKSEGIEIDFPIDDRHGSIKVFTTRPDTIYGATFLVLSPEHPIIGRLDGSSPEIKNYVSKALVKTERQRLMEAKTKTGVPSIFSAINPVTGNKIPIWISDYVLMRYGTGAIMGVPGSDVRDFEFADHFKLPKIRVIGKNENDQSRIEAANDVLEEGYILNSEQFNGLIAPNPAKGKFMDFLEQKGWGKRKINYHLQDWSVSRQRYWGTPIPIIYCENCGTVPVPEKDLPVELPYNVDFAPKGKPPLATAEDWVKVKCPNCAGEARREVETMDTFVDSSWYFLRYLDPKNDKQLTDKKLVVAWMPIDIYFGGAEHTLGHTLYSRFFVKFLQDIGVVPPISEYAKKRVHHGVILGSDGSRMSKSHGNVVNPDDEVEKYGADAVRLYLAFLGPYDLVAPWDPGSIRGVYNFLTRVWKLFEKVDPKAAVSKEDQYEMNRAIKKVGEDIEAIKFNTGVSTLMQWLNYLSAKAHRSQEPKSQRAKGDKELKNSVSSGSFVTSVTTPEYTTFLKLLAPYAPHITEELWGMMGKKGSIHNEAWPNYDKRLVVAKTVTLVVQINGKLRDKLLVEAGVGQKDAEKLALASDKVQKFVGSKSPRKVIFVPDRLINLVI